MKRTSFLARTVVMLLLAATTSLGAWADNIAYTYDSGTAGSKTTEGPEYLIDGAKTTKWCVTSLGNPTFIEFHTSAPIVPTGYVLTTGNDTGTYPGRNPKSWTVKAKANSGDSWTTIATVTNDTGMAAADTTAYSYTIANSSGTAYQYFRFEISAIQSGSVFQLSEFAFIDGSVTSSTTTMSNGTYYVNSNVTVSERIQISGTVNLMLGEGARLTASDGIEVPSGATLIIDGPGSLVACPTTGTNVSGHNGKSGIGGVRFGNIIINGGNVTAQGYGGGAGIGGDQNNWGCGDITINGGVVNATSSATGPTWYSAGIGGGAANWADQGNTHYGIWSTITINGGQVTSDRLGNPRLKTYGSLALGWTNETDFIHATIGYAAPSITFNNQFVLDGTDTIATANNINGRKIVPIINIEDATVSGLSNTYNLTGNPININYTVTYNGNTLRPGTDYTATITKDGVAVTTVKDVGNYTLTLTGQGFCTGTKSVNFSVVGIDISSASFSNLYYFQNISTYMGRRISVYCDIYYNSWLTKDTDYYTTITKNGIVIEDVVDAGDYIITFTGMGRFVGSVSRTFSVAPKSIADARISMPLDSVYNGNALAIRGLYFNGGYSGTESMAMSESDYDLTMTKDGAVVSEIREAGTYILTATGKNNFTGTLTQEFVVDACDFSEDVYIYGLRLSYTSSEKPDTVPYEWNGGYTVEYKGSKELVEGRDYVVTIDRDGVAVQNVYGLGHFTMTFTGIGNYKNSKSSSFDVISYKYIGESGGGWSQSGLPIDQQYKYCMTQTIFPVEEMGCAGAIKSIAFYSRCSPSTRTIDIYMTHTDKTSYSADSWDDWVPVDMTNDLVYSGEITFQGDGWDRILLDFPFIYDGQHSVALTVDDKTGATAQQTCFLYYNTDLCQTYKGNSSYPAYTPARPVSGHGNTRKPQMEIVKEGVPALVMPKDLAIDYQGGTSATVSWTERGTATAWQIGFDNGTSEQIIDVSSQFHTFTDLPYQAYYAVRVRATDGNGNYGSWTNVCHFVTDFCEAENMCNISFDLTNSIGTTWDGTAIEVVDSETGYVFGTVTNDSITGTLYQPLTTHAVVAVPAGRTIDFRWVDEGSVGGYCSWTVYDNNGDEIWSGLPYQLGTNGVKYYYKTGDILYSYTVDCTTNPYKMPVGLACTAVTGTTATLVWKEKADAAAWQICLNDDETNLIQANDTTFTLTGLTPETVYKAKVRAYGNDGQSRWTQNISFQPSDKLHIGSPQNIEDNVPTNVRSNYCLTEQIYLKEELGSARVFKSIDFFAKNYSSTRDLDIYMVHTDKSTFHVPGTDYTHEWIEVTPADKVFSGTVNFEHDVWTTIDFDVPFSYNGQDNVLLVVDDNSGRYTEYNYASLFTVYSSLVPQEENGQTRNFSRALFVNGDLDPTNLSGQSNNNHSCNSEIRLDFLKEGELMRPGFLTASGVTGHSATISWQENGTATAWQICLNDDEDHLIDVTTNPYTFTELIPETDYTVKVRSVSGNKYSDWSKSISFLASDKHNIGSGTAYSNYLPTSTFGSKSFTEQIYTAMEMGDAGLISSIDFRCQAYPGTRDLTVYMFYTDQSVFNNTSSDWITPSADDIVFSGSVTFTPDTWTSLEFENYFDYDGVSNVVLAVYDKTGRSTMGSPINFYVYDAGKLQSAYYPYYNGTPEDGISGGSLISSKNQIRLGYAIGSSVPRPTDLVCTASSINSATLSWTEQGTATAWQICLNGDDLHPIDATTNPFTVTGLTPFEDFTVRVRAVSGNEYSDWSKLLRVDATGIILVGSGSNSSYNVPVCSYNSYSLSEQIYTPTDITNAGGSAGSIVRIEYMNTSPAQTRNIDIYMMHTTTNSFSASSDYIPVTQADKVFSGDVTFKSGTWTSIRLTTPFAYDGQSNVLIVVDDNTGSSFNGMPVCAATFDSSSNPQSVFCSGSTDYDPTVAITSNYGGIMPSKNQIRLGILSVVSGDANHDGKLSVADITTVVNLVRSNGYDADADTDGNGVLSMDDVVRLVNKVLNK